MTVQANRGGKDTIYWAIIGPAPKRSRRKPKGADTLDRPETPAEQIALALSGSGVDKRSLLVMQEMAGRFERFNRFATLIETIAEDIKHLKQELRYRRRDLRGATKRQHVADIQLMDGKCSCRGATDVLDADGQRFSEAEFDHASSHPDAEHIGLICRPSHLGLTTGRVPQDQRDAESGLYSRSGGGWIEKRNYSEPRDADFYIDAMPSLKDVSPSGETPVVDSLESFAIAESGSGRFAVVTAPD